MLGTIVNSLAIILGSFLGLLLKSGIKDKYKESIMDSIALPLMIIGVMGALETDNIILIIGSMVVGNIIGEMIAIDDKLNSFGYSIERKFGGKDSNFTKGFVMGSLIFCIGAMGVIGAIESGLTNNHETLFAKSVLDGIFSLIFASSLGIGVAFSAIPVFIYQASITLMANIINTILTPSMINEMSAVGGVIILAIGINQLGIKKMRIANMLPAIFIPIIYYLIMDLLVITR